jgi:hypothetical protein
VSVRTAASPLSCDAKRVRGAASRSSRVDPTAEDAVLLGGSVAAASCRPGSAEIDPDGDIPRYDRAQWCRLIAVTRLAWSRISTDDVHRLRSRRGGSPPIAERPLAVGSQAVADFAVVHREDRVELQPPTGAPVVLRTLSGAENAHAVIAGERVFLIAVSRSEPERTRYGAVPSTRCLE